MSTVDPNAHFLTSLPQTGVAIVATSITLGVVSAIIVGLRVFVRLREHSLGWDDGLMAGGLIIYLVDVGLGCAGAYAGLGSLNADLNDNMLVDSVMYLMIWMLLYICSLVLIKSSICVTMLRIASANKVYRICIYTLLSVILGTFLTTFIGVLLLCHPVEANWNTALITEGKATCASMSAMIGLSYTSTAASIATDLACAVLPGVILWRTQMKLTTKISVSIILSFGSFASISTMIRTPYIEYYRDPTNDLVYHIGNIVLWSNVETAIGLVAGSLPSLRRLIMSKVKKNSSENSTNQKPMGLVTFGGSLPNTDRRSRNRTFKNNTDLGVTVATVHAHGDGDWKRLHDDSDQSESMTGIRAEYTYEVEMSKRSNTPSY
ncbi:hypothetical protein BX600DRAFT_437403 [Xylariales sp. PMI_506]|nr:hypothetical protein BX600DRAFT_437403 [Xylariales sp. PMI_506]